MVAHTALLAGSKERLTPKDTRDVGLDLFCGPMIHPLQLLEHPKMQSSELLGTFSFHQSAVVSFLMISKMSQMISSQNCSHGFYELRLVHV